MRRERRLRGERVTMDGWMEEGRNIRLYEAHKRQSVKTFSWACGVCLWAFIRLSQPSPVKGCSDCVMWSKSSGKGGYSKRVRGPLVRTIKRGRCERCRDHVIFSLSLSHTRTHRPGSLHPGLSSLHQCSHWGPLVEFVCMTPKLQMFPLEVSLPEWSFEYQVLTFI